VEARVNKDLETVVERTNASFEKTVREQTRWIATIVFSAIGLIKSRLAESSRTSSESGRQRRGASKTGTENKQH
jgi:hypothetical protein